MEKIDVLTTELDAYLTIYKNQVEYFSDKPTAVIEFCYGRWDEEDIYIRFLKADARKIKEQLEQLLKE
jgi:hypothetical protein